MKAIQKSLLAFALAGAFTTANATPVDWTFTNTVRDWSTSQGHVYATMMGGFTFDADTNTFSNFSVILTSQPFGGLTQIDPNTFYLYYKSQPSTGFYLDFAINNPFTNAGGDLSFTGYHSDPTINATITGRLVGVPQATASAVPEPEAYAMMLAGLGLVGFAARRKLG